VFNLFLLVEQLVFIAHILPFTAPTNPNMFAGGRRSFIGIGMKMNGLPFKEGRSFFGGPYINNITWYRIGKKNDPPVRGFPNSLAFCSGIQYFYVLKNLSCILSAHGAKIGEFFRIWTAF